MPTCLPEEPPLVEAAGEDHRGLGEAHEEITDREIDDEHVGGCPEAPGPVRATLSEAHLLGSTPPLWVHTHTCTHAPVHT